MSRDASEILKEVLELPAEARAALADSLLESLDTEVEPGAYEAWEREIRRRSGELNSKAVPAITWADVRSKLRSTLSDGRAISS